MTINPEYEIETTRREIEEMERELIDLDPASVEYCQIVTELKSAQNYLEHLEENHA